MKFFGSHLSPPQRIWRKLKKIYYQNFSEVIAPPPLLNVDAYEPFLNYPKNLEKTKSYTMPFYRLEQAIAKRNLPEYSFIIKIQKQNIICYSSKPSEGTTRQQTMRRFFHEMHLKFPAPDGVYIIIYGDSFNSRLDYPLLCYASKRDLVASEAVYLIPDFEAMSFYKEIFHTVVSTERHKTWEDKKSIIFWRGATTGGFYPENNWNDSPRVRFLNKVRKLENEIPSTKNIFDVGFSSYVQFSDDENLTKFKYHYPLKEFVPIKDALHFKYLIDIDGNSCSYSRMAWILYSNSLLLKHQSDNIQWYYLHLKENLHYLSIKEDFSNLLDQYYWAEKNPRQAKFIAKEANSLTKKLFDPQEIYKTTSKTMKAYQRKLMDRL